MEIFSEEEMVEILYGNAGSRVLLKGHVMY